MADKKITELTELVDPADEDLLAIVDDPAGTPITRKVSKSNFTKSISTDTISEKTTDAGVTIDGVLLKDGQVNGQRLTRFAMITPTEIVNTNPANTDWNKVDVTTQTSATTYAVCLRIFVVAGATTRYVFARKTDTTLTGNPTIVAKSQVSTYGANNATLEVNTDQEFDWAAQNADITGVIIYLVGYYEYVDNA